MAMVEHSDGVAQVAKLTWTGKRGVAEEFILVEGTTISLGRDKKNDIVVSGRTVSRRHTEISWGDNFFSVIDLGSGNGTYLNGEQITEPIPLKNGDLIKISEQILNFTISPIKDMDTKIYEEAELEPGEAQIEHVETMLYVESEVNVNVESIDLPLEPVEIDKEVGGMAEALTALVDQLRASQSAAETLGKTGRATRSRLDALVVQLESVIHDTDELIQKTGKKGFMDLLDQLIANPNDVTLLTQLAHHATLINDLAKVLTTHNSSLIEIKQALGAELIQLPAIGTVTEDHHG